MNVTLHNTDKLVVLQTEHGEIPARVWEGVAENGLPCHAFIARIAIARDAPAEQAEAFAEGLTECTPVSAEIDKTYPRAINLHLGGVPTQDWPRVEGRPDVDGEPAWVDHIRAALSLSKIQGKGVAVVGLADLRLALQAACIVAD